MRYSFNGTFPRSTPFGVYDPSAYANYPGQRHPGTDYALPANTQLVAGMTGTVVAIFRRSTYVGRGNEVVIESGNFQRKTCHMNRIDVQLGQTVTEGQPIGLSGNTGYVLPRPTPNNPNAGAHLHDELLINGQYVDLEKNLNNGAIIMDSQAGTELYRTGLHREPENLAAASQWNGLLPSSAIAVLRTTGEWKLTDTMLKNYAALQAQVNELTKRPSQENFDNVKTTLIACQTSEQQLKAQIKTYDEQTASDVSAGDSFVRRLGQFIKKYLP